MHTSWTRIALGCALAILLSGCTPPLSETSRAGGKRPSCCASITSAGCCAAGVTCAANCGALGGVTGQTQVPPLTLPEDFWLTAPPIGSGTTSNDHISLPETWAPAAPGVTASGF